MYSNPFTAFLSSGIFLPDGRTDLLTEIAQVITLPSPDNRDLHGLAGMGKSALLRYVSGPEFIESYKRYFFDPYNKHPARVFIPYIAGWIETVHPFVLLYREFFREYERYYTRVAADQPHIDLPKPLTTEVEDMDGSEAISLLESQLRGLAQAGIRTAILLDNFDGDFAYKRLTADETTRLSSWKEYCSLILATERRLEDVNPVSKGSPLYKGLTPTPVRDMWPDEAKGFLNKVLATSDKSLPEEDIDLLIKVAGGFRYLLLLAGRVLWDLRRRTGLGADLKKPLPAVVRPYLNESLASEFQRMFELYYEGRTPEQRQVLLDLAHKGSMSLNQEMLGQQYIQLMGLEQFGLVDINSEGEVCIFSPLFRAFLMGQSAVTAAPSAATADLNLTELQTNLYNIFRDKPEEVVTFEELGRKVWSWKPDPAHEPTEEEKRKIHIAVSKLRRELERSATGERIVNLRSRGYRFEPAR